jgi:hypothetical protein
MAIGLLQWPDKRRDQGDVVFDFLVWLRSNGFDLFEAEPQAEASWTKLVAQSGAMTLFPEANSWYMRANIPGEKRQIMNYVSVPAYVALCDDVAEGGYYGFAAEKRTIKDCATI